MMQFVESSLLLFQDSNGDLVNYSGMGNGAGSASMAALASAAMAGAKRKLDDCDPMKTDVKKVRKFI